MENCLTYALRMARYGRARDHLVIRRSHWGWFPHFSVLFELENGDLVRKEYVPIEPRKRWIPPLFFKGKEVTTIYQRISIEEKYHDRRDHLSGKVEGGSPADSTGVAIGYNSQHAVLDELGLSFLAVAGPDEKGSEKGMKENESL